jgi:hypothetical protein
MSWDEARETNDTRRGWTGTKGDTLREECFCHFERSGFSCLREVAALCFLTFVRNDF